jgi:hypothetical protein
MLWRVHRLVAAVGLAALTVIAVRTQAIDPQTLGPVVGQRLPDFTLPDQHGTQRSLRSLFGPKGAVVVFYRSADW